MAFAQLTRPDGSAVSVNVAEVLKFAPVPTEGPTMGPLKQGTRVYFKNGSHQDVCELQDAVMAKLGSL